jgi:hypothetical protein
MPKPLLPPLPDFLTGAYTHIKSGMPYVANHLEYLESNLTIMVSYTQVSTGHRFSRPYADFIVKFHRVN